MTEVQTITTEEEDLDSPPTLGYACFLAPQCAAGTYYKWCPVCIEEGPLTKEQARAHHIGNEIAWGMILPYAPVGNNSRFHN